MMRNRGRPYVYTVSYGGGLLAGAALFLLTLGWVLVAWRFLLVVALLVTLGVAATEVPRMVRQFRHRHDHRACR